MTFDKFTKAELEYSVNTYKTWSELLNSLGVYNTHNKMAPLLKTKLDELEIDYSKLEYNIVIRRHNARNAYTKMSSDEIFKKDSGVSHTTVRKRFRELTSECDYVCAICKGDHLWNGKELVLVMAI